MSFCKYSDIPVLQKSCVERRSNVSVGTEILETVQTTPGHPGLISALMNRKEKKYYVVASPAQLMEAIKDTIRNSQEAFISDRNGKKKNTCSKSSRS